MLKMSSAAEEVRKMLVNNLCFYPGLVHNLDRLLLVLSPEEIAEICLTFPKVDWLFEAFTPEQLKELLLKIRSEHERLNFPDSLDFDYSSASETDSSSSDGR
jgi:hypothetical protein